MAYTVINGKLVKTAKNQVKYTGYAPVPKDSILPKRNNPNDWDADEAPKMPHDKGLYQGSCNRSACLRPGATWYNRSTRLYYCRGCAEDLNFYNKNDSFCKEVPLLIYIDSLAEAETYPVSKQWR